MQFEKFGDPIEVLHMKEQPDPEPGPHEIRVKMKYRSINPSDLYYIMGRYGLHPDLPAVPGFEGMGYVDKIGSKVRNYEIGKRVIPIGIPGTWKEFIITNTMQLFPVPENVKDQSAAQLIVNPMAAWIMTNDLLDLKQNEWLLQTAAGSTLGRIVIQISKLKGFKTINFVRRREQIRELLDLGADAVICTEDKDIVKQVMKITDGGAHAGIDAVGGKTGALAASSLRNKGTLIIYGLLSMERTPIDTGEMVFKETIIKGFWLNSWFRKSDASKVFSSLKSVVELMAVHKIEPPIEAEYEFENFKKAIEHSLKPGNHGKILLKN